MNDYDKNFLRKYQKSRYEKDSILCAGFDPAIPKQREKDVLNSKYFERKSIEDGILYFLEDFLDNIHEYCSAIKPNNQFLFHFSLNAYKKMNKMIHEKGLISILDHKLGDIGSTNDAAFFWMREMGFDAVTFSPFAGNIAESIEAAHKANIGLITLTLMSNPEAVYFMKNAIIDGQKGYEFIARTVKEYNGDGVVVGATGHISEFDMQRIRELIGQDMIMLIPGIGSQQGDIEKVVKNGGKNILVNVSRAIMYSDTIRESAKAFNQQLNKIRKKFEE